MGETFPIPFRGIDVRIPFENATLFVVAVESLLLCGHQHNYAVQGEGRVIWTNYSGGDCIQRALEEARGGWPAEVKSR